MKVVRVKNLSFNPMEVEVPIPSEVLNENKVTADHSRKIVIPAISKI